MKRSVETIQSLERRTYFSTLAFSAPVPFATGSNPSDVVAADLTGNGITDVITSDFTSANIAVLRGNGNGTFQAPVFYPVGNSPEALAVGDFNGDGIPDIVTANEGSNTVSVLLGHGDGTFAPQVTYPVGVRPESVAVADLTGNGHLDIVTANQGSNTVSVLLNNGNGAFQPAVSYPTGAEPDGIALGDLNSDGFPDIVTVNTLNDNLHVLLNHGNGTFAAPVTYSTNLEPRAVTIAVLSASGQPDVITANSHSASISLLNGNGDGTLQSQQNFATGTLPFAVAVGDFNGDGRPDIVTVNNFDNTVEFLVRNNVASFSLSKAYRAGLGPVAVAVADVNGDGKSDLVVADFNTSTISVLTNQSKFTPLIPTAITLTANQNPVEVKNRLVLTAQLTPSALAKTRPGGVVDFYAGYSVIGVARVSRTGVATISTSKLAVGSHRIFAHYNADSIYAGSSSTPTIVTVVTPAEVSPLVAPTIDAVRLPPAYVAGEHGTIDLSINDIGDGPARGTVEVQLYASLSSTFDSSAIAVAIDGSSDVAIKLAGGFDRKVGLHFTVPANLAAGNYTFFAALAPVSGLTAAQVSAVPAVGITTAESVLEFGRVGALRGYRLTRTLAGGTAVTLSLSGPGTGILTEHPSGGISIALTGTTGGTNLSILSNGVTLDGLTATGAVGNIIAPTTTATGAITLQLGVRRLTLAGATNSNILISGGTPNILSLGDLTGVTIYSAAPIRSLSVNSYTNTPSDSVTTAWIGSISSAGDFGANLTINGGVGGRHLGLTSATIGGTLEASTWSVLANVATLQVEGVASGWSGSIHGTIASFVDFGDFAGDLAAHGISSIRISGSLTSAVLLAGADFGANARLGNNDDTFTSGILSSLMVSGSATNSFVAAGISPVGDNLQNPGAALLRRSAIRSLTVLGSVDSSSRFLSSSLPSRVKIDGLIISPVGDPNFSL